MRVIKKEDIHFQNNFEDKLVEDPGIIENVTTDPNEIYYILFSMGAYSMKGYKIFDYLMLNTAFTDAIDLFINDLYENDLYEKYVDSIFKRKDEFLKAYSTVYLDARDIKEEFGSERKLADVFIKDDKYEPQYRLNGLMGLCEYKCGKGTIRYIKQSAIEILKSTDEFKSISSEEEKNEIIKTYLDTIDEYQKEPRMLVFE